MTHRGSPARLEGVSIPQQLETARRFLRPWCEGDAEQLAPILEANVAHLGPWIPARVSTPATVPALRERLSGFATDFADERFFRYAMFSLDDGTLLGEADLFPRNASGRALLREGDRAEIGYWLRADRTGQGLVTEGVRALIAVAGAHSAFTHLEIRCDAANAPSVAIPTKLGFRLAQTIDEGASQLQVWTMPLRDPSTEFPDFVGVGSR